MTATGAAASVWRASSPESVDDDLQALWKDAARDAPIARAIMSNLVVLASGDRGPARAPEPRETLVRIARRHPARVVLIAHCRPPSEAALGAMNAGLLLFDEGADAPRYGVEVVSLVAACADASLPSIVRSLLRGGVPTSLWVGGDLSTARPAAALLEGADQIVFSSAPFVDPLRGFSALAALLTSAQPPVLVDLAWRELAAFRAALLSGLEGRPSTQAIAAEDVTIAHGADRAAAAWLLWSWLGHTLAWPDGAPRGVQPSGEPGALRLRIASPAGALTVDDHGDHMTVQDGAGRTFDAGTRAEAFADAVADSLLVLDRDAIYDQMVRRCAAWRG